MPGTGNLSSAIQANVQNLMETWENAVRKEIPAAANQDREELFNSLPEFLERLAYSFSAPRSSTEWDEVTNEIRDLARQHGTQRASQKGYTLDQVIAEHQILRHVLFHFVQTKMNLYTEQWSTLLESVDAGISEAATAFALERGFKDARYRKMETEKNQARSLIDKLEIEKSMREQFVSMLSHDLRTPITSAKLAAELIARETKGNVQISKLAIRITDDLSRSDRMIRDLLDANRIRSGEKLPLTIEETELVQLVKSTIINLERVYGDRFTLDADHEIVGYWSAADLERCIENLVINATKYGTHDAPIDLRVIDQGEKVGISVHNVGSFIPPSEQEALFQPFAQFQSANRNGKTGWGLGLTLIRGIAEAHGGNIQVESDVSKGTTFTIFVPKDARKAIHISI
jgi:signal transduction histidine kinase